MFTTALSHRLHPDGIVKKGPKEFNAEGWWLDSEDYVDSSFALEIPCTEFFSQGLELDWAIFGWDACFRPNDSDWDYMYRLNFKREKVLKRHLSFFVNKLTLTFKPMIQMEHLL